MISGIDWTKLWNERPNNPLTRPTRSFIFQGFSHRLTFPSFHFQLFSRGVLLNAAAPANEKRNQEFRERSDNGCGRKKRNFQIKKLLEETEEQRRKNSAG